MMWVTKVLVFCLFAIAAMGQVLAQDVPRMSVEVALDSSGSMLDNDPRRLSIFAGMIFADVLDDMHHLGVETMRRQNLTLSPLSELGKARKTLRKQLYDLKFDGGTDCGGPLEVAQKTLATRTDQRAVLFLSDGICPLRPEQVSQFNQAVEGLRNSGIQVFSVGLFDENATLNEDPERDLKFVASTTGGEYFRAKEPQDLPGIFASVVGRLVGSEAQVVTGKQGKLQVDVDPYVLDATLILTSTGKPIRLTRGDDPSGESLKLPVKTGAYEENAEAFFVSTNSNGSGAHYTVLRLKRPKSGAWSFVVDGPTDIKGLLIQNFGLNPVIVVADSTKPQAMSLGTVPVGLALLDLQGNAITDLEFLKKVTASVELVDPSQQARPLTLSLDEKTGRFLSDVDISKGGQWKVSGRARMQSGLNKSTETVSIDAIEMVLALGKNQGPIDFGSVKAGALSEPFDVDLSGSELMKDISAELKVDLTQIQIRPADGQITAASPKITGRFEVDKSHLGGPVQGTLEIIAGGLKVTVPVKGEVIALTFWERWGERIIELLVGLFILLFLIFLIHGFVSPHDFPPEARINWGNSLERLEKNRTVIREIAGARRGFRRNAQLRIGGPKSFLSSGAESAVIETVGPNQMVITIAKGAELRKVNKFDPSKDKVVEGDSCPIHAGEIFKIGDLYLRVQ